MCTYLTFIFILGKITKYMHVSELIISEWFTAWRGKYRQNHQDGHNCLNFFKMALGKVFTKNKQYEKLLFTFWIICTKNVKYATKICSFSTTGNNIHFRVAYLSQPHVS